MGDTENWMNAIRATPEIAALHTQLAAVLETIEHVLKHEIPLLTARYQGLLGDLEYQLFNMQVEVMSLRQQIEQMQAILNRGEAIDPAQIHQIEADVAQKLQDWTARLCEKARVLQESQETLAHVEFLSPAETRLLKTTYRRLARLLHPDVSPENIELFEKYWETIQQAYASGDVAMLEAVLALVEGCEGALSANPEEEIARLQKLLSAHGERLIQLQQAPPICFARQLDDGEWIRACRAEIQAEIVEETTRRDVLLKRYTEMTGKSIGKCVNQCGMHIIKCDNPPALLGMT